MDPKVKAIVVEMRRHVAQMRNLKLQLARLRLTTTDLPALTRRRGED